jgi:hypothetical protein
MAGELTSKLSTTPTSGVVLMAFNKEIYFQSAAIMAHSIKKHNPEVQVTLITDGLSGSTELSEFDNLVNLPPDYYRGRDGSFQPGKAKLMIYDLLPYDNNLILDVDGYCLQDIAPLIERLSESWKPYQSHTVGYHTIDKGRNFADMQWAWADRIWNDYKLSQLDILPAINSSIVFVKKCKESKSLYDTALTLLTDYFIPIKDLRYKWGNAQPDELYMNVSLAMHGLDPAMAIEPMYFQMQKRLDWKQVKEKFYFMSYYGGKGHTAEYYINEMQREIRADGFMYNLTIITKNKHVNTK